MVNVAQKLIRGFASAGRAWLSSNGWVLGGLAATGLIHRGFLANWGPALVAILGGAALARRPFRVPRDPAQAGRLLAELLLAFLLVWTVLAYARHSLELGWELLGVFLLLAAFWAARRADLRVSADFLHPLTLGDVISLEKSWIQRRRVALEISPNEQAPMGIALSGGGIRSAAVSYGFTRELARRGWLHRFDYMSTVSGGGWLGSMLTAAMTSPEEARGLLRGNAAAWDHLLEQLKAARSFVSLDGEAGARRLGTVFRQLGLGLLFNAAMLVFVLGVAGMLPLHVGIELMFKDERFENKHWVVSLGEWEQDAEEEGLKLLAQMPGFGADRQVHEALIRSAAPNRALELLDRYAFDAALMPGSILLAVVLLVGLPARLLRVVGPRASDLALGFARGLLPYALGILLLGAVLRAHVVVTLFALFLLFRAALAQLGRPPRGTWRTLLALVLASLPLLTVKGRADTIWMTNSWHCRAAQVMAGFTNLTAPTYLYIPCPDPSDDLSERLYEQRSGWRSSKDRPVPEAAEKFWVVAIVAAGPALILAFVAIGFWVQRNALDLHEFLYRQLAQGFFARTSRDPAVWPLEDLDQSTTSDTVVAPIHLLNAAVNVPGSDEPTWRRRGGARFEMSPLAVGGPATGWVRTSDYEGRLSLARAAAISGAAINPQGGHAIVGLAGLLLNLLNFRLGTWIRNPRLLGDDRLRSRPLFSPSYLLREWLGTNSESDLAVFVSDGGHDDNLGLGALVDRGCGLVVVLDAAKDGAFTFRDLARALEGVAPEWEAQEGSLWRTLVPQKAAANAGLRTAQVGAVAFSLTHRVDGRLCAVVYAKSVLTPQALTDPTVARYARLSGKFPHEPTADQWFDPEQLQAYIGLGQALAGDASALLEARHETSVFR